MQESVNYELIAGLKLRPEEQFIIHGLRRTLGSENDDGIAKTDLSTIDWNIVYEKSMRWGVAPLLNKIIKEQSALPQFPDIADSFLRKIKIAYLVAFFTNETNFKGVSELLEVVNKAGIKAILLKGSHIAQFVYRDVGLRPMSDIDILVKEKDLNKAEELLFQSGYDYVEVKQSLYDYFKEHLNIEGRANITKWYKTNHHHLFCFSNPEGVKHLEIHRTIEGLTSPFSIDISELWKRSKMLEINEIDALVLSPEDLLLHASLHASYHHRLRAHGLRPCCDIAAVISHYEPEIDWDQLQMRAFEWGAEKYIYLSLRLSHEILGARVPDRILLALKPSLFDEKIVLEAQKRVLLLEPNEPAFKGMRSPAKIQIFSPDDSLLKKACYFLQRLFVSNEELAARYSLPPSCKRIYFYHFVRFISLLYSYIRVYSQYFLYRLVHKKDQHFNYNLDLWLSSSDRKKRVL
jgi:predicted nucleotidyltransferase